MLDLLKPTPEEIARPAHRETDPARCAEFEPIAQGFVVAVALIIVVGLAGAVTAPIRLIAALLRKAGA